MKLPTRVAPIIGGWKKVDMDDINLETKTIKLSTRIIGLIKQKANQMGISESQFIEMALASASPGSAAWRTAEKRAECVEKERRYLSSVKRRMTMKDNKSQKVPESRVKTVFREIVENNISGKQLEDLIEREGIALQIKGIANDRAL